MRYTIATIFDTKYLEQFGKVIKHEAFNTGGYSFYYVVITPAQFCYLMLKHNPTEYNKTHLWMNSIGVCVFDTGYSLSILSED